MKIGNTTLETKNNIFLAPMAGITDLTFRLICKEFGVGLLYSEMVSAKGFYYNSENTMELLKTEKEERPVGIQIFGSDPEIMADMALKLTDDNENLNFDFIDINMGCPAPKIVKNGEGSALMKEPKLVGAIIKAVVKASKVPVSVKFRKGFNANWVNAVEIAKIAEDSGAFAVCVHGRTREQFYSGNADYEIIKKVVDAVSIPVIGNGDVVDTESAERLFAQTGCQAIAIGRGAEGNPWIFKELISHFECKENGKVSTFVKPTNKEKIELAIKHCKLLMTYKDELTAIREMRKHICWYLKGIEGATKSRVLINKSESFKELEEVLLSLI